MTLTFIGKYVAGNRYVPYRLVRKIANIYRVRKKEKLNPQLLDPSLPMDRYKIVGETHTLVSTVRVVLTNRTFEVGRQSSPLTLFGM